MKHSALLLLTLVASGCSKIQIKDIPIYWDAGNFGAVETHLVSESTADIAKAAWDEKRFGAACLMQEDFAWLRATFEKLCIDSKFGCSPEEKKMAKAFLARTDKATARIKK